MSDERTQIRLHTINYKRDSRETPRALINLGFWLHNTPRLTPLCRLLGHRVVVDGVDFGHSGKRSRWACCDRCGVRLLQPVDSDLEIGEPYTGPLPDASMQVTDVSGACGTVGGQLIIGPSHDSISAQVKIGNAGSEHTLAAHLHLHHLGALYLHTERHGTWFQRRLNPAGYDSRVIGLSVHDGHLRWEVWAKRNESSRTDPWWMRGSVPIDPRDIIWGPRRYTYSDVGEPVTATVRMPHGDDHTVTLQLQRQTHGRARGRRPQLSWSVGWNAEPGIPTKSHDRGRVQGSGVAVSDQAVEDGGWAQEACAAIAARMTRDRVRYGYRHESVAA